jgi:uncharacterized protein YacL (UPF0231 family)
MPFYTVVGESGIQQAKSKKSHFLAKYTQLRSTMFLRVNGLEAHFRSVERPLKGPPTWRWFQDWLKSSKALHTIRTKPISKQRTEVHTNEAIRRWFDTELKTILKKRNIQKASQVYNIDETSTRVRCPNGEEIVFLIDIKELYTCKNKRTLILEKDLGELHHYVQGGYTRHPSQNQRKRKLILSLGVF